MDLDMNTCEALYYARAEPGVTSKAWEHGALTFRSFPPEPTEELRAQKRECERERRASGKARRIDRRDQQGRIAMGLLSARIIRACEQEARFTTICERVQREKQQVGHILQRLVEKGLVRKVARGIYVRAA